MTSPPRTIYRRFSSALVATRCSRRYKASAARSSGHGLRLISSRPEDVTGASGQRRKMKRQELSPEIEALHNRELSIDEVAAFLASPVTDEEVASTMELVDW